MEGSRVPVTFLFTLTGSCNEDVTVTDYGVFYWPRTSHSRRVELACPYGGVTSGAAAASRRCDVSATSVVEWAQPVYKDCSTVILCLSVPYAYPGFYSDGVNRGGSINPDIIRLY